jgi:hypothetical protein
VTGYYKKGNLVMKRGPIMRRYLRTWFIFDIIATLPYTWFIKDRDVDYWPDDDFDETAELNKAMVGTMHSYLQTDKLVSTLGDFDLAQTMRLLKLTRCVRVIKLNQVFKLRKLVYRVRF